MASLRTIFSDPENEQECAGPKEDSETPLLQKRRRRRSRDIEIDTPFPWLNYGTFALLGMAMLWSWNMILAASPYFLLRFQGNEWVLEKSQSAIITVSTASNLVTMSILTKKKCTSYASRIYWGLSINSAVFILLALSTIIFEHVGPSQYLGFILVMAVSSSWASCLIQNGCLAFAAGFGRPEYMQAIMAGQGVAGVLPSVAQIVSVLVTASDGAGSDAPQEENPAARKSTLVYFSSAVCIYLVVVLAFIPLERLHRQLGRGQDTSIEADPPSETSARNLVGLATVFKKLHWCCAAVFTCFVFTMFFPVLTPKILSMTPPAKASPILTPTAFIPLALFFWNLGDLVGRGSALALPFRGPQPLLFALSIARVLFLPLYALCNLHGRGAVIPSDLFYLLLVQFPYGLTNGWLASNCMMTSCERVDKDERELAGGLMALCLTFGLTFGSVLSFTAAGI